MQRFRYIRFYCQDNGYTLLELLVLVAIVCGLMMIKFERSTDVSRSVNVISVDRLESEVRATTTLVYSQCHLHPECDVSNPGQLIQMEGRTYALNYGWLDAGDALNNSQIDAHVNYEGFAVELVNARTTRFVLPNAPDPASCSVSYHDAWHEPESHKFFVLEKTISGC